MAWHTLITARARWVSPLTDEVLADLLEVAEEQCITYLGSSYDEDEVGARLREAQLQQARNVYNASKADPAVADDGTQFVIRPYPLDHTIRQLLLPKPAMPEFF